MKRFQGDRGTGNDPVMTLDGVGLWVEPNADGHLEYLGVPYCCANVAPVDGGRRVDDTTLGRAMSLALQMVWTSTQQDERLWLLFTDSGCPDALRSWIETEGLLHRRVGRAVVVEIPTQPLLHAALGFALGDPDVLFVVASDAVLPLRFSLRGGMFMFRDELVIREFLLIGRLIGAIDPVWAELRLFWKRQTPFAVRERFASCVESLR